jgi:hypothetical protein
MSLERYFGLAGKRALITGGGFVTGQTLVVDGGTLITDGN